MKIALGVDEVEVRELAARPGAENLLELGEILTRLVRTLPPGPEKQQARRAYVLLAVLMGVVPKQAGGSGKEQERGG